MKFKYLLLLLVFPISCAIQAPGFRYIETPILMPSEYNINEIRKYYPEYANQFDNALKLYEEFKYCLIDSTRDIRSLFISRNDSIVTILRNLYDTNSDVYIGLKEITIDSSFYFNDTISVKQPIFKIGNYPIPFPYNNKLKILKDSVIDNHLNLRCSYGFFDYSNKGLFGKSYLITLKTKKKNDSLFIEKINISDEDSLSLKIPFFLRPFLRIIKSG